MSAVCAYTVGAMHNVFMGSRFSGPQSARSRQASVEKDLLLHMKLDWMPFYFILFYCVIDVTSAEITNCGSATHQ